MRIATLLDAVRHHPEQLTFTGVMATISAHYHYTPTRFSNGIGHGQLINAAGTNEGSCRIFAFAMLHGLSERETLALFGDYYRRDVLENPAGTDHANIRMFMRHGWQGIHFDASPLTPRVNESSDN
ncbi:MAG: HopJ type III effector protein [Spongiibacteraceae bacterium]|nr:HopJ type III effector protein [Spongiibacteraceae bacterium]